ncbi:hypothetical protein LTR36_009274 [Oleoguttula mirabilis]|uniref:Uncharacterized protein n=1 Tax=Oleoguttula mirabilis TaxID=1507867 RepID=A0AAV9J5Z5_9PEZI|nr:hypothetical protein LTR36_009274 [Oleoguttula mirabilis]
MRRAPGISFGALCALALHHSPIHAQSSTGVGDYVAAGLGVSSTSQQSSSATIPPTQIIAIGVGTTNGTVFTATKLEDGEILVGNTTLYPSGVPRPTSTPAVSATASLGGGNKNASVDECFTSWEQWWSASYVALYGTSIPVSTYTTTDIYTNSAYNGTTQVYTRTLSEVDTIMDGLFAISTETLDTTYLSTYIATAGLASTSTGTYTGTSYSYATPNNTLPTPTCYLPRSVSQCQSEWDAFITTNLMPAPTPPPHCDIDAGIMNSRSVPPCAVAYQSAGDSYASYTALASSPLCTQASIGGALCSSIRDNYVHQANYVFGPEIAQEAEFFSAGYLGSFANVTATDFNTVWAWPTAATLGVPSCTLGCGRCAVTGGTVQLIYWPQATATATANNTARAANTAAPSAQALVTAETLGTTFTSPTLYISYANVYAANGCSNIGTTISNTIVAIPPDQPLSSVYGGTIPCDAHFRWTQEWTATAPFNVSDLYTTPVPYSIYSSQPWCATYLRNAGCVGTCPTTAAYKPILVVPEEILQEMEPEWSTCYGDIRGVYDPPIALQPAASVVGPAGITTSAGTVQTQSATPASGPGSSTPSQTAQGGSATNTVTAEPDSVGSTSQSIPGPSGTIQQQTSAGDDPTSNDPGTATQQDPETATVTDSGVAGTTSQNAGGVLASVLGGGADSTSASGQDPVQASTTGTSVEAADPTQAAADPTQSPADPSQSSTAPVPSQADPSGSSADTVSDSAVAGTASQNAGGILASVLGGGAGSTSASGRNTVQPSADSASAVSADATQASVDPSQSSADPSQSLAGPTQQTGADPGDPAQSTTASPPQTVATVGSQAYTVGVASAGDSSSAIVVAQGGSSVTILPGASATSIGGQRVSAAVDGGVVVGSGSAANTLTAPTAAAAAQDQSLADVVTIGSQAYSVVSQEGTSSGIVVVANGGSAATLTAGGSAATIGSQIVSAPQSGGVVVGSGSDANTLALPTAAAAQGQSSADAVTVDAQTYSVVSQYGATSGVVVVANGGSTATLIAGGSATSLGGEIISAPQSGGVVVGSGNSAATIVPAEASSGGSSSAQDIVSVGGETFAASSVSNGIILQNGVTTATLSVGGAPVTVGSQVLSEASDGAIVAQSGSLRTTILEPASSTTSHSSTAGAVSDAAKPSSTSTQTASAGRTSLPLGVLFIALMCSIVII